MQLKELYFALNLDYTVLQVQWVG